jgi:hypothetical protein
LHPRPRIGLSMGTAVLRSLSALLAQRLHGSSCADATVAATSAAPALATVGTDARLSRRRRLARNNRARRHRCRHACGLRVLQQRWLPAALETEATEAAASTLASSLAVCCRGRGSRRSRSRGGAAGCKSVTSRAKGSDRTNPNGVANARQAAQAIARKLAGQLQRALESSDRVLIAVQNRGEGDEDQYWLGFARCVS